MAGLRVIAGQAKGRRLKMVPGDSTRPISDRAKEALFNIIGSDIAQARVLDLFAGTGAVGIEALSRGAERAVFLDRALAAVQTIRANLRATGFEGAAEVIQTDAFSWLARVGSRAFDYVYVAPPQYQDLWSKAVSVLDASPGVLSPDAWVVAQMHPKEYRSLPLERLTLQDQRRYGSTLLAFFTVTERDVPGEIPDP